MGMLMPLWLVSHDAIIKTDLLKLSESLTAVRQTVLNNTADLWQETPQRLFILFSSDCKMRPEFIFQD